MKRGEIWWANLPQPIGRRPVLLISRDAAYTLRANIIVIPLTRTIRNYAVEVLVSKRQGVPQKSVINADTIFTIPKTLLMERITTLPAAKMRSVERAIAFALNLELSNP